MRKPLPKVRALKVPDDGPRLLTHVLHYRSFVTFPADRYDDVIKAFERLAREFGVRVHAFGVRLHEPCAELRHPSSDEAAYLPRKVHLRAPRGADRWACRTEYVSLQYLTDDPAAVTCRMCLRTSEYGNAQKVEATA